QRLLLLDRPGLVDGGVAALPDHLHLEVEVLPDQSAQRRLVDLRRQIVLVRAVQAAVGVVEPGEGQLKGAAGVEAGGPGVGPYVMFGSPGLVAEVGPLGPQEGEVAHRLLLRCRQPVIVSHHSNPRKARSCNDANNASNSANCFCCTALIFATLAARVAYSCCTVAGGSSRETDSRRDLL